MEVGHPFIVISATLDEKNHHLYDLSTPLKGSKTYTRLIPPTMSVTPKLTKGPADKPINPIAVAATTWENSFLWLITTAQIQTRRTAILVPPYSD